MAAKRTKRKSATQLQKRPEANRQKTLRLLAFALAIFGFLLYINTLGHDYVLDDFSVIKENFVTKQGFEGIPTLWKTHARYGYWNSPGELYRPVPMTMFAIEWALAPDQPWLGHLINILLYALTGALLFLTLRKLLKGYSLLLPFLATLFFVAHPVHVEVAANIKSRDEIVMFLCSILAINFLWRHLEGRGAKWLVLSLLSYTVALFSKENAVTFVAIVPLAMYFFSKCKSSKIASTTLLFAVPALIFVLVRKAVIGDMLNPGGVTVLDNYLVAATDPATRLANAFLLLGKYLGTLLFPHPLSSDFGYNQIPLTGWGDWRAWLSLLAWAGMGGFAVFRFRKKDLWAFAILFFLINFSIFSNIFITIGSSFGDRFLYTASPGFALALALALLKIFKVGLKIPNAEEGHLPVAALFKNKILWAAAGLILAMYSLKTVTRNLDWTTSYSLYQADIETAPNSAKLNFHYGIEIVQKGLAATSPEEKKAWFGQARTYFEKAIGIYPAYHDAYSQLGLTYYRDGDRDKAMENYQLALKYKPNFPLVYSNMGILYFEKNELEKAKECYENAVKYDPRMVDALRNLGAVHAMQKNFTEAIRWFSQALQYAPDDPVINRYLGSAYRDSGQEALGRPYLQKAERLERGGD
ncbi:MAG: tetratricopeptide repeat protein [Saprospiraceae bacterium]|nr:MAG: tetratricopeptide repeat protein [Saprospiraceae bacterium]